MIHSLQTMTIPASLQFIIKKIRQEHYLEDTAALSGQKLGVVVYHCNTGNYYSTQSSNIQEYLRTFYARFHPDCIHLPAVVRQLIKLGGNIELYVFPFHYRSAVESEFQRSGFRRVITAMGSQITKRHLIYEVRSRHFGLSRYISGPETDNMNELRKKANKNFVSWLTDPRQVFHHKREAMKMAMRFELQAGNDIFKEDHCDVYVLERSKHTSVKLFRSIVEKLNQESIDAFIYSTTTGVPRSV